MTATSFPNLTAVIDEGINRGLHTAVQVYVSQNGQTLVNDGFGEASPGVPMSAENVMLWRSAGKPVTAAAVLKACSSGQLSLDHDLESYIPEAHGTALEGITLRQMLSHSSGIPLIETGWPHASPSEILHRILSIERLTTEAAYQPQSTWFLLATVLQNTDPQQRGINSILQQEVFAPLGITEAWCGIPAAELAQLNDRLPTYYLRDKGQLVFSDYSGGSWLTETSPGGNIRGPIAGLGRFYEMLLTGQNRNIPYIVLDANTIQQITTPQRVNQFDTTLQHTIDFGLGVILNSNQYGVDTVPYGFSQYCSTASFGHGGAQCAMGFCDPEHNLVVAWAANGFCGEGQHQRRNRAINEAIYADLQLT
ncbi:MAG: serine hydrolase domain-containing protein [Fuerstiella sp.]